MRAHRHEHESQPGSVGPLDGRDHYWHHHAGDQEAHEHRVFPPTCSPGCGYSPHHAGSCERDGGRSPARGSGLAPIGGDPRWAP